MTIKVSPGPQSGSLAIASMIANHLDTYRKHFSDDATRLSSFAEGRHCCSVLADDIRWVRQSPEIAFGFG
jgi:hypothetical protein